VRVCATVEDVFTLRGENHFGLKIISFAAP
jgi:hypothetical protein